MARAWEHVKTSDGRGAPAELAELLQVHSERLRITADIDNRFIGKKPFHIGKIATNSVEIKTKNRPLGRFLIFVIFRR